MKNLLVTGGAGFIGSNFCKYMLAEERYNLINLDSLTYAGNLENLTDIELHPNYQFIKGDIRDRSLINKVLDDHNIDIILNFAAESHVDRSILDSTPFVDTNIKGTLTLLDAARDRGLEKFIQISTDEVYGSLGPEGAFREDSPLKPNSPYSASKTSADLLVYSYYKTYGLPVMITRCSNNYGPYQFPEKLIPLMIINAMEGKKLPVYGDGLNVRDWIYVEDHCKAVKAVMEKGRTGEVYNIGGEAEEQNINVVKLILQILGRDESLIEYVKDRPGHDRRYAMDISKISSELGWEPEVDFQTGLEKTIEWYLNNKQWYRNIRTGAYVEYYEAQYGNRLNS